MSPASSQRSRCSGLGELGVAPQEDLAEARPTDQGDGLVQEDVRPFLGGAVAAAIDQVTAARPYWPARPPADGSHTAVVGEVHPLLALAIAGHDAAIGLEDRLGEELGGLLGPDPQPRLIDRVHQGEDIGLGEAAAEVPGGGRVRDAFGPQGVEVDLIVAPQLEVLDAAAAGEEIEGDVQDVVGFVVGQVPLEEVEVAVDLLDQPDLLSQEEEGADAAGTEAAAATGVFVVDIGGGHHGYRPLGARGVVEPFLDPPSPLLEGSLLACRSLFSESGAHSKAPLSWNGEDVFYLHYSKNMRGFRAFSRQVLSSSGRSVREFDTDASRCVLTRRGFHPTRAYFVSWIARIFSLKNSRSRNP